MSFNRSSLSNIKAVILSVTGSINMGKKRWYRKWVQRLFGAGDMDVPMDTDMDMDVTVDMDVTMENAK